MKLYHNIEQNKRVKNADDVADDIVARGFWGTDMAGGDLDTRVWFSSVPLLSGGQFTGVAVEVPDSLDIEQYRQAGDALEELEVKVYAIDCHVANDFPRTRWYVREGEGIEG